MLQCRHCRSPVHLQVVATSYGAKGHHMEPWSAPARRMTAGCIRLPPTKPLNHVCLHGTTSLQSVAQLWGGGVPDRPHHFPYGCVMCGMANDERKESRWSSEGHAQLHHEMFGFEAQRSMMSQVYNTPFMSFISVSCFKQSESLWSLGLICQKCSAQAKSCRILHWCGRSSMWRP